MTINRRSEMLNRRLELTGLAKPGKTCRLTGMGPGLAHQEAADQVFGLFWNLIKPFFQSKPRPLKRYLDLVLAVGVKR